jgi:hypothetical protein
VGGWARIRTTRKPGPLKIIQYSLCSAHTRKFELHDDTAECAIGVMRKKKYLFEKYILWYINKKDILNWSKNVQVLLFLDQ